MTLELKYAKDLVRENIDGNVNKLVVKPTKLCCEAVDRHW